MPHYSLKISYLELHLSCLLHLGNKGLILFLIFLYIHTPTIIKTTNVTTANMIAIITVFVDIQVVKTHSSVTYLRHVSCSWYYRNSDTHTSRCQLYDIEAEINPWVGCEAEESYDSASHINHIGQTRKSISVRIAGSDVSRNNEVSKVWGKGGKSSVLWLS